MANTTDPKFEYDAPTYVDFEEFNFDGSDSADEWFDKHGEDVEEGGESVAQLFGFEDSYVPPPPPEDDGPTPQTQAPPPPPAAAAEATPVKQEPGSELPLHPPSGRKFYGAIKALVAQEKQPVSAKGVILSLGSPQKKVKVEGTDGSHTPGVLKRYLKKRHSSQSSMDLELEVIHRLQRQAREQMKKSRRSFRMLAKSSQPIPVKGSKPTTIAKEFKFRTKARERSQQFTGQRSAEVMPNQFATTLRSNRDEPTMPEATKVKPFRFHLDSRVKEKLARGPIRAVGRGEPDVPTAEAVARYQTATPPRFHSASSRRRHASDSTSHCNNISSSRNNTSCELTFPKTPNLVSHKRSRPVTAKSSSQTEEEEMERNKGHQFKARPINPEVFTRGGMYGVKQVADVGVTEAKTPNLATKRRQEQRRARDEEEEGEGGEEGGESFHAKPMPNFEKLQGLPKKRCYLPVVPQSPALQLKRRCLNSRSHDLEEDAASDHVIKATPMPSFEAVFVPERPHKATELQPFEFERRDRDKPSKETLVQMIMRKTDFKKPDFKAQLVPDFSAVMLPMKAPPPSTSVQPFQLLTSVRGEQHASKWEEKVTAENEEQKRAAEFKSRDASALYSKPFLPAKSSKPLTDVSNVVLHSDVRFQERSKFDSDRAQRDREREQENRQHQAELEAREAKELGQHRRELVHKAQSIQHYAPFVIKPSVRPNTVPFSPHLATKTRLRGSYTLQTDV